MMMVDSGGFRLRQKQFFFFLFLVYEWITDMIGHEEGFVTMN